MSKPQHSEMVANSKTFFYLGIKQYVREIFYFSHLFASQENEIHLASKKWQSLRNQITNVDEAVREKESFYNIGGNVNQCNYCGKQYNASPKNKNKRN